MIFGEEELKRILSQVDPSGFTVFLWGEPARYVVGLTNNKERSLQLLLIQVHLFAREYETVTIGGRCSPDGNVFIDVGTCTDDLELAKTLGCSYHQVCIWDRLEEKEIFL